MPKNPKILCEIIGENSVQIKKKLPIIENTVLYKSAGRGGRGRPAEKVKFNLDCLVLFYKGKWPFKRLKQKLVFKEGASECINFRNQNIEVPSVDKDTVEGYFKANVIRSAGATTQKLQVPIFVYIMLVFIIFLVFINLMLNSGSVQIR